MEKNLYVSFYSMEKKVLPKTYHTFGRNKNCIIYVAQNATQGCQFSVLSKEGECKNLKIEVVGDLDAGVKIELLREGYVSCEGALYPDPVFEDDCCFDLEELKNVTYLINASTTLETAPGNYEFKVNLYVDGELYEECDLSVRVWDFAINPEKHMDTSFGIDTKWLFLQHKTDDKEAMYKKYYDFLLERYHICGLNLPYDILDPRADEYLNDPRVTNFKVPYIVADDQNSPEQARQKMVAYYNKLKSNPKWLEKAMFYVVDEPLEMADYDRIDAVCKNLESFYPEYKLVVPYFIDPRDRKDIRAVDLLEKYNVIWCPKSCLFKDEWMKDYMASRREKGDLTWWYCCWEPQMPYANLFTNMEGFYHRVLLWQQYAYGINGFLYWQTTHWECGSPWDYSNMVPWLSYYCFGDGTLLYNGDRIGVDGPVGSLRLELVRSAIEDYHMLQMAEKAFGREYVEEQISRVTANIREYCDDYRTLNKVRVEIGQKLSEYYTDK